MNENHKATVAKMITIYCRKKHTSDTRLCTECANLLNYAHLRLEKCVYGADKPECKHCTIHCYKPEMRERIKMVMRYAGPLLMIYHPLLFTKYIAQKIGKTMSALPLPGFRKE